MDEFFYLDESCYHRGYLIIRPNADNPEWHLCGRANFNILPSRMLGMSYYDYLIYCRDELGAEIFSRDVSVPYPLFPKGQATEDFVAYLNETTHLGRSVA